MQRLAIFGGIVLLAIAVVVAWRIREGQRGEGGSEPDGADVVRIESKPPRSSGAGSRKSSAREGLLARPGPVYSGPRSLAEWTPRRDGAAEGAVQSGDWAFREGVLYSSAGGSIAHELPLPATCRIAFRVRWEEQFRFRLLLFCDGSTTNPDNCYDLIFQRNFAYLRKRWLTQGSAGSRIIGQATVHSLSDAKDALIELLIHRDDGTIALFVNGKREGVWVDEEHEMGEFGDWIQFVADENSPVEIAKITADEWDATYPDTGDPHAPLRQYSGSRAPNVLQMLLDHGDRSATLTKQIPQIQFAHGPLFVAVAEQAQKLRSRLVGSDWTVTRTG